MGKRDDGGGAYPNKQSVQYRRKCTCGRFVEFEDVTHPGMTMRQFYKGICAAGLLATTSSDEIWDKANLAKSAAKYADAMIAEDKEATK